LAFDLERIVATFSSDAYVIDKGREIWGVEAIRKYAAEEFVGDGAILEVREVIDHFGDIIVRAGPSATESYDKQPAK
jgi:hypothetical protein